MPKSEFGLVLSDFVSLRPKHETAQTDAIRWLAAAHARSLGTPCTGNKDFEAMIEKLLRRYGCHPAKVGKRGHQLPDFTHRDWDSMQIFGSASDDPHGADISKRTEFFLKATEEAFEELYPHTDDTIPPDDLIHVTCTGMALPSAAQNLISRRSWNSRTTVTHLYFMGCAASIPAVRTASGLLSSSHSSDGRLTGNRRRADIVHTELCTLHLNPADHSPEELIGQSLFADGMVKYTVRSDTPDENANHRALRLLTIREQILRNCHGHMTWKAENWGMKMHLDREIPQVIAESIVGYTESLFSAAGLNFSKEKDSAIFAVHPGGPRILDRVEESLKLSSWQIEGSRKILFERGNMSSATLPHIWQRIIEDPAIAAGTLVATLGFSPGLTVCGALLRKT